jgi:prepilin-type processing-associated H-X9-DG protein
VELLVVMAVIAILAALVLTAAFRAMDVGRQTQCRGNLNQIGRAFWLYVQRWDQWMPAIGYPPSYRANGRYLWWYDAIEQETRQPKLSVCPAKPQTRLGYGYNVRWADPVGNTHCWNQTLRVRIARNPSATIAFADAGNVVNWKTHPPPEWKETDALPIEAKLRFPYRDNDPLWNATCSRPMPRHRGMANFLMFDGGVQSHRVEDILGHKYGEAGCLFDNK